MHIYFNNIDRIDNNWLAVPIISDLRALRFNKKTFDYCINKGYNLHYPPVSIFYIYNFFK